MLRVEKRVVLAMKTVQHVPDQAMTSVWPASWHSLLLAQESSSASLAATVWIHLVRFVMSNATAAPGPQILTASVARAIALWKMARWCV